MTLRSSSPMRLEERLDLAHGNRNPLRRLLPRIQTDLGLRRQRRRFHRYRERMRRHIVRENEYWRLAALHEVTADGEDEVGIGAEHLRQISLDRVGAHVGAALEKVGCPAGLAAVVEQARHLGPEAARTRKPRGDDA